MTYFGDVLVIIAGIFTILDMVLWRTPVGSPASGPAFTNRHILLQIAVLLVCIALLSGVGALIHF